MCGIVGQINKTIPLVPDILERMRDTLSHRGPDDAGLYISDDQLSGLGHRRLSFLDLSPLGRQPLANENDQIQVVVNGEIYNYLEIKKELESKGHRFASNSDSEVIVHGYEEWGIEVLQKLMGMFAFGLWDESKKQLFLARDRFGIKPLYYFQDKEKFVFASEIKAIIANKKVEKKLDYSSVCDFLVYRYIPSPKSIWENIKKLPPAHFLILNKDKGSKIEIKRYWTPKVNNAKISDSEAIEAVNEMLSNSINAHTMGDVPVGSFLSGGYDSSALVLYMHKAKYPTATFSIGFENWSESEHQYAELVANTFGTSHRSKIIGPSSLNLIEKLAYFYDEPLADISIIPTYEVSKIASENVKAVLSGEGADEIFGGYEWHRSYNALNQRNSFWQKITGTRFAVNPVEYYANAMEMGRFDQEILRSLLHNDLHSHIPSASNWFYEQHVAKSSPVKTFQLLDISCFMGELVLTKIDRASMANSLEVRVPFLDHKLVEYLLNLHEKVYFKEGVSKFLLHENIKKEMPQKIMERPKQGFVGPDEYYQNYDWYKEILLNGNLVAGQIVKREFVEELLNKQDHWRLWKVLILENWYQTWHCN